MVQEVPSEHAEDGETGQREHSSAVTIGKRSSLDTHALIREYFGKEFRKNEPDAWEEGHQRLYNHFREPLEMVPSSLREMIRLYRAIGHGCNAKRHLEAFSDVYWKRIAREEKFYSMRQLGAYADELAALASFFSKRWTETVPSITGLARGIILGVSAFCLRAIGNLPDAMKPMMLSREACKAAGAFYFAAQVASYLSDMSWSMGQQLDQALEYARESVRLADQSQDMFMRRSCRTTVGDVLHQMGRLEDAEAIFKEAESIGAEGQLTSVEGARYCDLLLSKGRYDEVDNRARTALKRETKEKHLLSIARHRLCLGRALVLKWLRDRQGNLDKAKRWLEQALIGLRDARLREDIPWGLMALAELYRHQNKFHLAQESLGEALAVTESCSIRLLEVDCHIEFAHLHFAIHESVGSELPLVEARNSLGKAQQMMKGMGYGRRSEEVAELSRKIEVREKDREAGMN